MKIGRVFILYDLCVLFVYDDRFCFDLNSCLWFKNVADTSSGQGMC